jgi:GNAT superfamily N-acetyltransferase
MGTCDANENQDESHLENLGCIFGRALYCWLRSGSAPILQSFEAYALDIPKVEVGNVVIEIVPFAPQHAAGVVAVILPIQQSEFAIPITVDAQPDLLDIGAFYQHGNGNFWVALKEGEVVGTVALLDIGNRQAALRKMFVRTEYRGGEHGVAKHLLAALLDWSRARVVRQIYLGTTSKFLAAHRFYEKNGFREMTPGELPKAFPVMAVDTKFYCRTL